MSDSIFFGFENSLKKVIFVLISILALLASQVYAQQPAHAKRIILEVVWEPSLNSEVFMVDGMKINTIAALKKYLSRQAAGSIVEWDPGCVRFGDKPLLSTEKELKEFQQFLEKKRLRFVVIPSG